MKQFGTLYCATNALMIYSSKEHTQPYIEFMDINKNGYAENPRPLTLRQLSRLAKTMAPSTEQGEFLQQEGVMPANVIKLKMGEDGYAIWFTPSQKATLHFEKSLGIPSPSSAWVPPLIWKATTEGLTLFACKVKPKLQTEIYHAPFFNIYVSGAVCMGNVKRKFDPDCSLENFMLRWQNYFFGSYFSHLIASHEPIKNITEIWQHQCNTGNKFPFDLLKRSTLTLKDIL